MNWRRGLLRAWFLFSLVWIGAGMVYALNWSIDPWRAVKQEYTRAPTASEITECNRKAPGPWCSDPLVISERLPSTDRSAQQTRQWIAITFGVPILLFGFGFGVFWVRRGFKSN